MTMPTMQGMSSDSTMPPMSGMLSGSTMPTDSKKK
jgi:hypothetical protein